MIRHSFVWPSTILVALMANGSAMGAGRFENHQYKDDDHGYALTFDSAWQTTTEPADKALLFEARQDLDAGFVTINLWLDETTKDIPSGLRSRTEALTSFGWTIGSTAPVMMSGETGQELFATKRSGQSRRILHLRARYVMVKGGMLAITAVAHPGHLVKHANVEAALESLKLGPTKRRSAGASVSGPKRKASPTTKAKGPSDDDNVFKVTKMWTDSGMGYASVDYHNRSGHPYKKVVIRCTAVSDAGGYIGEGERELDAPVPADYKTTLDVPMKIEGPEMAQVGCRVDAEY